MKNSLLKISVLTLLLASCSSTNNNNNNDNEGRIVESGKEDSLVFASKKANIPDNTVPSVSDKIVITKDTVRTINPLVKEPLIEVTNPVNAIEVKTSEVSVATPAEISVEARTEIPKIPVEEEVGITSAANAAVGECYGKVKIAARFKDVEEKVMVSPEKTTTNIIPAKFADKEEEVVVREESFKYVEIPATYKTVTEEVVVEPEKKELITIPAQYKTVTEKVMVQPVRKVWKKGSGVIQKVGTDGDILCLVEEPAVYKDVEKQVMVSPERTETRVIPAVKRAIAKQVIDQPARVEKIAVPAIKEKITQRVEVEAEKTVTSKIPAVYQTVKRRIQVSDDRIELLPVICDRNINKDLIIKLQAALAGRGYDIGKIDGFVGPQTSESIYNFQKSMGLESGGITYETIKALNIVI